MLLFLLSSFMQDKNCLIKSSVYSNLMYLIVSLSLKNKACLNDRKYSVTKRVMSYNVSFNTDT